MRVSQIIGAPTELLTELRAHRSEVVGGFLGALGLLGLISLAMAWLPPGGLGWWRGLGQPAVLLAITGVAGYGANRKGYYRLAVVGALSGMVGASAWAVGAGGGVVTGLGLSLLLVAVVLAGVALGRVVLVVTTAVCVAVAFAPQLLAWLGRGGTTVLEAAHYATEVAAALLLAALLVDRIAVAFHRAIGQALEYKTAWGQATAASARHQDALHEVERFNETIIENLPGVFFLLDRTGSRARWNRHLALAMGYEEREIANLCALGLVPEEDRRKVSRAIAHAFKVGHAVLETTLVTKEGERRPYVFTGTRVEVGGSTYLAGLGLDRSEIGEVRARVVQLDADLRTRLERLTALHAIDKAIVAGRELDEVLEVILEQVTSCLHVDAACVLLHDPSRGQLDFAANRGFLTDALRATSLRLGEGLAGQAAEQRRPVVVRGRDAIAARFERAQSLAREGFVTYVALPLIAHGQLRGVLEVFDRSDWNLDEDAAGFLDALGTQAALALHCAVQFDRLERMNRDLLAAYDTTIEGWARAMDLRDEETVGHSRRVTELSLRLAGAMGFEPTELRHLRWGALLHDIGKMAVPDEILKKKGPLTAEERRAMELHPIHARELLKPIEFLHGAIDVPYFHHEHWDGHGYPTGRSGDDIPLAARIFAVVDVYDALTSDRPYREAWSSREALKHIEAGSGKQFDPEVVATFVQLMVNTEPAQKS